MFLPTTTLLVCLAFFARNSQFATAAALPAVDAEVERRLSTAIIGEHDIVKRQDVGQVTTFPNGIPEPVRGNLGGPFLGDVTNVPIDQQNPDNVSPPNSDAGTVPNLKWPFSLSHTRLLAGGWIREQTITDLPQSTDISAVQLRLDVNAYRELHWHSVGEWGYVLNGSARLALVDNEGRNFIEDVHGPTNGSDPDIWYFPAGVPHSIQALDEGMEAVIVFDNGNFDARGTTFQLSDWLIHTPLDIVGQNFGIKNLTELANIPKSDPFVLPDVTPPPANAQDQAVTSPQGTVPQPFVFHLADQARTNAPGGWLKVQDSLTNFPIATTLASALVFVDPGALRELHWHKVDEWIYIISGTARATAFPGQAASRTFDFQTGDTGLFPTGWGHYVQNLSPTDPLIYLEVQRAPQFFDVSAIQWLALTPHAITADLLGIPVDVVDGFPKTKQFIIAAP